MTPETTRTFYRSVYLVEVLSEAPFAAVTDLTLGEIATAIEIGDMNGNVSAVAEDVPIDAHTAAQLLIESGSDPGFFGITDTGEDV